MNSKKLEKILRELEKRHSFAVGAYSRVYRFNKKVIAVTGSDFSKRILSKIRHKNLPKITYLGTLDEEISWVKNPHGFNIWDQGTSVYSMPYYRRISNKNRNLLSLISDTLDLCMGGDDDFWGDEERNTAYFTDVIDNFCSKNYIPRNIRKAFELIGDELSKYNILGGCFDVHEMNTREDNDENIILLDPLVIEVEDNEDQDS